MSCLPRPLPVQLLTYLPMRAAPHFLARLEGGGESACYVAAQLCWRHFAAFSHLFAVASVVVLTIWRVPLSLPESLCCSLLLLFCVCWVRYWQLVRLPTDASSMHKPAFCIAVRAVWRWCPQADVSGSFPGAHLQWSCTAMRKQCLNGQTFMFIRFCVGSL
jgi:hypothetical protein